MWSYKVLSLFRISNKTLKMANNETVLKLCSSLNSITKTTEHLRYGNLQIFK